MLVQWPKCLFYSFKNGLPGLERWLTDDLSSMPGTHLEDGENWLLQVILWLSHGCWEIWQTHPKMVWAKKEETFNFHLLNDRTWAVTTKFLSCFTSLKNIRSNTSQENRHFKFSYGIKSYKRQRNALHLSIRSREMKRLQFGVAWTLVCVCLQIHKLKLVLTSLKQLTRTFNNLLVNSKKLVLYQSHICI